jgi:hypothetical protein
MQARTARFRASTPRIGCFDRILRPQCVITLPKILKSPILAPQSPEIGGMSGKLNHRA